MNSDFQSLVQTIEESQSGATSPAHGPDHWRKVAITGLALADSTPECDLELVLLFALLHDSQREDEYEDPEHPARAADFASDLVLNLSSERLATLLYAIRHHTDGQTHSNPTIAVCWDADRLNLWRVGIVPDPTWLSTNEAKTRERILWASKLQKQHFEWSDVLDHYHLSDVAQDLTQKS
jgi:uncharacterized protein